MDQVMLLLQQDVFREQVKYLSPHMKAAFIDAVLVLFEQETETMLDVIEESRWVLTGSVAEYEDELEELRAESRMLETRREDESVHRPKTSRKSRSQSSLSYEDECQKQYRNERYAQERERKRQGTGYTPPDSRTSSRSSLEVPANRIRSASPGRFRSASPFGGGRGRVTPAPPVSSETLEKETQSIMKNLSSADAKIETERQRQERLFHERRERRKREQEEKTRKALELLQKMVDMDRQWKVDKQSQEQKLKERIEEKKRQKMEREETELFDLEKENVEV